MMFKKELVSTNSSSIAAIEYELYKSEEKGNDVYAIAKVTRIVFYEQNYYHSSYTISIEYFKLIERKVSEIEKKEFVFTKEEWKDQLPF